MIGLIVRLFKMVLVIVMVPIIIVLAIPMAIIKFRSNQRDRLLYTGREQALIGKAQNLLRINKTALLKPDICFVKIAEVIEQARCDYQIIKKRERFDLAFTEFVVPKLQESYYVRLQRVINFFELNTLEGCKKNFLNGITDHQERREIDNLLAEAGIDIVNRLPPPKPKLSEDDDLGASQLPTAEKYDRRGEPKAEPLSKVHLKIGNSEEIVNRISVGVNDRLDSRNIAYQFVLEELDAARQGNEMAVKFVMNSGFSPSEYEGALDNPFSEVDGPDGPQQFLIKSVMPYFSDMDYMVALRLRVVENVIDDWGIKAGNKDKHL